VLHLTDNANSQQGAFIMPDFNTNAPVKAVTASFAVRIADGSGTPADGISFCWGSSNSIPDNANFGEGGQGDGLIVSIISYAGAGNGPSFNIIYHTAALVRKFVPYSLLATSDLSPDPLQQYATFVVRVNANGTLDLQYKGNVIFNAFPLPGYTAMSGARFALGARTGRESETHRVDNIQIATTAGLVPVPLSFSASGGNLRLTWDTSAGFKLQSATTLSPANWTDVPGATSPYFAPLTGPAQFFRLAPAQ